MEHDCAFRRISFLPYFKRTIYKTLCFNNDLPAMQFFRTKKNTYLADKKANATLRICILLKREFKHLNYERFCIFVHHQAQKY